MSVHVIPCPECSGSGGIIGWKGQSSPLEIVKRVCEVCNGKRLVSVKASDLEVLEPFEGPEEPKAQ